MNKVPRERAFLGLHWKGFFWISLLLIALSSTFYLLNDQHLLSQFRAQRQEEMLALNRQIEGLLTRNSDRLIRLSGAVAAMSDLGDILYTKDKKRFASRLLPIVYDMDVNRIEVYTIDAEPVWHWPQSDSASYKDTWAEAPVEQVRQKESPVTLLSCQPLCLLNAFVPILAEGKNVGVIGVGQLVADFVIEFQVVTQTDIALIMPASSSVGAELPSWNSRITALTNSETMSALLQRLSRQFANPAELEAGHMMDWDGNKTYEIHSVALATIMPDQEGYFILISDVTARLSAIRYAARQGLFVIAGALAIAELLLLYLVGVPLRRLEHFARTLPLLAQGAYKEARERFSKRRRAFRLRDEIDYLCDSAVTLSDQLEANTLELAEKNHELAVERDFIRGLLASAQVLVMTQTRDGVICSVNEFTSHLTGCSAEELQGRKFADLIGDVENRGEIVAQFSGLNGNREKSLEHEHEIVGQDGERRKIVWVHTTLREEHSDGTAVLSVGLDVTERAAAESRVRWLASHDPLTGLVNRQSFNEELNRTFSEAQRTQATSALFLLDVDHFKEVNDSAGHAAGDELLRTIADEIRARTRKSDVVARLGGDEFAVLMRNTDLYGAESLARELNDRIKNRPFTFGEKHYRLGLSIGVALLPHHGTDVEKLMSNADMAMFEAKRSGRSRYSVFSYEKEQEATMNQGIYWKDVLTKGLAEKTLFFQFQPVCETLAGRTVFHEALLRLKMVDGRVVLPGEFLSHMQRSGLSLDLDSYVVRQALEILGSNPALPGLALNLTGAALSEDSWCEPLLEAVEAKALDPSRMIFEIAETVAIDDLGKARRITEKLTHLGFRFAVDDFGAGFGSLYYLKQLPISYVKIDRSLIQNLVPDAGERGFVKAIVAMVHAYGKIAVAEGVEDAETLSILKEMEVDLVQGHFLGQPASTGQTRPSSKIGEIQ